MPPETEGCWLGSENKAKIGALDDRIDDFKADMLRYMDHTDKCITKLTNHFAHRISWGVALALTGMSSALVALAMYIITK